MKSIVLELSAGRCIQGAARARQKELVSTLLKAIDDPSQEESDELEMLNTFLEQSDFPALRARHPLLDGRTEVAVRLMVTSDGFFETEILSGEGP